MGRYNCTGKSEGEKVGKDSGVVKVIIVGDMGEYQRMEGG